MLEQRFVKPGRQNRVVRDPGRHRVLFAGTVDKLSRDAQLLALLDKTAGLLQRHKRVLFPANDETRGHSFRDPITRGKLARKVVEALLAFHRRAAHAASHAFELGPEGVHARLTVVAEIGRWTK